MANLNTITISAGAGHTVKQVLEYLRDDRTTIATHFIDTADPTSPSNGNVWMRSDTATRYQVKARVNGSSVRIFDLRDSGAILTMSGQVDFDNNQALTFNLERFVTGSIPSASAANEGRICWDDTKELGVLLGSASRWYVAKALTDGTTYARIPARLHVGGLGTPATASTATTYGGWLLDAVGEQLIAVAELPVPVDYTAAHDCAIVLTCVLAAAETAGDDIDFDGTWRSVTPNAEAANKSASNMAAVAQDIGSNNAQYSLHEVPLAITYNDATNPVASGDRLEATVTRDGLTNVAGVIVVSAHFRVPVFGFAG